MALYFLILQNDSFESLEKSLHMLQLQILFNAISNVIFYQVAIFFHDYNTVLL